MLQMYKLRLEMQKYFLILKSYVSIIVFSQVIAKFKINFQFNRNFINYLTLAFKLNSLFKKSPIRCKFVLVIIFAPIFLVSYHNLAHAQSRTSLYTGAESLIPIVSISANETSIVEGETFEVMVSLNPSPNTDSINVMLIAEDIGIGKGYFGGFNHNPVEIGTNGVNKNPVIVSTNTDNFDEHDGEIRISVATGSNLYRTDSTSNSKVSVFIFDNDAPPRISITAQSIPIEGSDTSSNREASFEVTLSAESFKRITVYYATGTDGTAIGTSNHAVTLGDYIIKSGTLTFAAKTSSTAGVISQQITVKIIGDKIDEENETFEMLLTNADNATLSAESEKTIVKIIDDDSEPMLSINSVAITEGNSNEKDIRFTLMLSSISGKIVTLDYETISGTATAGEDFTAIDTAQITIPPRTSSVSLSIKVRGDTHPEADETFTVQLSNAKNATIEDE